MIAVDALIKAQMYRLTSQNSENIYHDSGYQGLTKPFSANINDYTVKDDSLAAYLPKIQVS